MEKNQFDLDLIMEYAGQHSSDLPDILSLIERNTHLHTLKPRMLSGIVQGQLLRFLVSIIPCKTILEVGTFTGYATICMAEGLSKDGHIHTIEYNEEHAALATTHFQMYEKKQQITLHIGPGLEIIPCIPDSIDFAFIDADKDNNENYFEAILPKIRKNGLILIDNVLWTGKVLMEKKDLKTTKIDLFNKKLANDPRVQNLLLPLRDGLHLIRKL